MPPIEIFRVGTHTAMSGQQLAFGESDLAASAAAYDPAKHEAPIVVGHPRHDRPAYGWVGALKAEGGALAADPRQVDSAFAEMVAAGRFKKVSACFYPPTSPDNPVPGVYYLRHVGFLGAQPPAVRGLKAVAFADGAGDLVEIPLAFAEGDVRPWIFRSIADIFRSFREWVIAEKGVEAADQVVSTWRIDEIAAEAERLQQLPTPTAEPAFAAPTTEEITVNPDQQAAADLAAREQELAAREAAFAERAAAARRQDDTAFVDGLVAAAKLPAARRDDVLAFMSRLDADELVAFGEGDGAAQATMLAQFKGLMTGLPQMVAFGEHAPPAPTDDVVAFAAPSGWVVDPVQAETHTKALAYQRANPGTDYIDAVRAVQK